VFGDKFADFAQFALTNPLGHGEGLRALTYPKNIYRKIEVPRSWIENPEFLELRNHFFSRFVMTYHAKADETYQICTASACEVQGTGFDKFRELFKMHEGENE
jgi:hypothetical protein